MNRISGYLRAFWLSLLTTNEPWETADIKVHTPAVKRMIARARLDRMREAGAGMVRKYSRDPVVEWRERRLEQLEQPVTEKPRRGLRMVV